MKRLGVVLLLLAVISSASAQLKVAVWETKCEDGSITAFQSVMVRGAMEASVANVPGFSGYDRAAFDAIVKEQNFQRSGAVSDNDIRRLGEMAGVDFIIVPEAMAEGKDFYIIVKMLDVETGQYGAAYEELCTTSAADIKKACSKLSSQLFGLSNVSNRNAWKALLDKVTTNVTTEIENGGKHIGDTDGPGLAFQLMADGSIYCGGYGFDDNTPTSALYIAGDGYEMTNCPGAWAYSGKFKGGQKEGDGMVYDRMGRLIYAGNFSNDRPTGTYPGSYPEMASASFGIVELSNGQYYIGEQIDGDFYGMGIYIWDDGDAWWGTWENDKQNGVGMMMNYDGSYKTGIWQNGQFAMTFEEATELLKKEEEERIRQEKAKITWSERLMQFMSANAKSTGDGWILGDTFNGYCIQIGYVNGSTALYCGQIKDGLWHGNGMCVTIYGGDLADKLRDSWAYIGEWKKGLKHGKESLIYNHSGDLIYHGKFGNDSYFDPYPSPSLVDIQTGSIKSTNNSNKFGGLNGDSEGDKYIGAIRVYKGEYYRSGWGLLIYEDGSAVFGSWYYNKLNEFSDAVFFSKDGEMTVVKAKK